jgi:hypothetical protein
MKSTIGRTGPAGTAALVLAATANIAFSADTTSWLDYTISPVSNPILFEDPKITSEIHPVYMYHILPDAFNYAGDHGVPVKLGGQVQVTAVQLRYAINDRLAIIATKDGYIEFQPDHTLAHHYGFADVAAGLKYAVVDDQDEQLIVTPGFTITLPIGSTDVYQGHGAGMENIFVSAEKGFDKFHIVGNVGVNIPNDFDKQTAELHYSLQLDYYTCQWFIPFFAANGYTILSDGRSTADQSLNAVPLNTEGYDLIDFGSASAAGTAQFTVGGGFRTRFTKNVDAGIAYEAGVIDPVGIFDSRITADVVWRF